MNTPMKTTMKMTKHQSWARAFTLLFVGTLLVTTVIGCGGGAAAKKDRDFSTSGDKEADQRAAQLMAKDAQLKGGKEKGTSLGNKLSGDDKTGPNGVPKADEKKTLYDRLGGDSGITAIVDDFVTRALADPLVNLERNGITRGGLSLYRGDSMQWRTDATTLANFKKYLAQFVALKTAGPAKYEGGELKALTEAMHYSNAEFDAAVGDLKQTMDKLQIPNQEQKELLAIVESARTQITEGN